ncbi:hypothetical protein [Dyella psychrodurans]|uniref:Uncharacterized protein n=1 Tax=Dyella psychrodurans TaxID=1927960 RepID=A0A370X4Y5_9GAMM|nr:hypothetical protein [Dyella psychrodurans]RDS83416.1 hypothetical protein DWU99_12875 [Dyella psychrodurans]
MKSRQIFGFPFTGGVATIANFGSRILLGKWMSYVPAIVTFHVTGMITCVRAEPTFRLSIRRQRISRRRVVIRTGKPGCGLADRHYLIGIG